MTEMDSERTKLAPILGQILHFQPKEIHAVTAIWNKKDRGPLGLGLISLLKR